MCQLHELNYSGIICIKSTILPQTTKQYIDTYNNDKICHCPEFLREKYAKNDFIDQKICIIGTLNDDVYDAIKNIHHNIVSSQTIYKKVHPTEAEITKYYQNIYNTYRIIFANTFYEVCQKQNICYDSILNSLILREDITDNYLKCNDTMRGPAGHCLVKDTLAFNQYLNDNDINQTIIQSLVHDMFIYKTTD